MAHLVYSIYYQLGDNMLPTVDGRTPAPPVIYETLSKMKYAPCQLVILPSTVPPFNKNLKKSVDFHCYITTICSITMTG